jgi:hypothetical protein
MAEQRKLREPHRYDKALKAIRSQRVAAQTDVRVDLGRDVREVRMAFPSASCALAK